MLVFLYFPIILIFIISDKKIFPLPQIEKYKFVYFVLFLIMGLREGFGRDYEMYEAIYNIPYGTFDYPHLEYVWHVIYESLKYLGFKSRVFFLLTSGIIIFGVFKSINLYKVNFFIATLVFILSGLYFETSNTVRQCVAQVLIFMSLPYIRNGKTSRGYLFAICSFFFHNSSIFGILLLFMAKYRYNVYLMITALVICCFGGQIAVDIVIERIVPALAALNRFQYDVNDFSDGVSSGLLKYVYLSLSLLLLLFQKRMVKISPLYGNYVVNLVAFSVCTYCAFYHFQPVRRLFAYGFMFIIVAFPIFLKTQKALTGRIIGLTYALIFLLFQTKLSMGTDYDFDLNLF